MKISFLKLLPRRLDVQVALLCAFFIVGAMPWFIVHEADEDLEYYLDVIEKQTRVLAENVAVTSVEHIVTHDYTSLEKLNIQSIQYPGVIDLQVVNTEGQILSDVHMNKNSIPETRYSNTPVKNIPKISETKITKNKENLIVWSPVKAGSLIGWIRLNYSLENANNHRDTRINDYMKDFSLLILALITILFLAMRRPIRMIKEASDFAGRLVRKTGEQMALKKQSKEIDDLYISLNHVSSNLADQDDTIKKIVKDLETQKQALDEHSIVSITDVNGVITYANDKLLSLTGFNINELVGKTHKVIKSNFHDKEFFSRLWETILKGEVWHGDIVNFNNLGEKIWMQTTIVPFLNRDGMPYEFVAIQTDITPQKKIEDLLAEKNKSLKELADQLESKVRSRTAELEAANDELMQLNTVKSDFVSIVSHELRTPLTSIKSFAEILEEDFEEIDVESRKNYLSIINEESERLGKLINDVLDLQKIDAGKMVWNEDKTDLKKLATSTVELFSKSYQDKGLELQLELIEDDVLANVDSSKIKQVLTNLLSNAYKFTEAGKVSVEFTKVVQTPTILLVDDDEHCREKLKLYLEEMDLKVISVANGMDALMVVQDKSKTIDLLITDIVMPEVDGVELIKTVRGLDKKLPIMAMSNSSDKQVLQALIHYNVVSFFEKSIDLTKFKNSIEKLFGQLRNLDITHEMIEISVIDTGAGIPDNELNKIFEHFHQVDNSETREKGGSGLGLCICQEIVEHHGGKLWVTSKLGKGSCFTFNLPLLYKNSKRIGEILVEAGVVTQESIDEALANQK